MQCPRCALHVLPGSASCPQCGSDLAATSVPAATEFYPPRAAARAASPADVRRRRAPERPKRSAARTGQLAPIGDALASIVPGLSQRRQARPKVALWFHLAGAAALLASVAAFSSKAWPTAISVLAAVVFASMVDAYMGRAGRAEALGGWGPTRNLGPAVLLAAAVLLSLRATAVLVVHSFGDPFAFAGRVGPVLAGETALARPYVGDDAPRRDDVVLLQAGARQVDVFGVSRPARGGGFPALVLGVAGDRWVVSGSRVRVAAAWAEERIEVPPDGDGRSGVVPEAHLLVLQPGMYLGLQSHLRLVPREDVVSRFVFVLDPPESRRVLRTAA